MKKVAVAIVALIWTSAAFADCYDILTSVEPYDSRSFSISIDDLDIEDDDLTVETAGKAIHKALRRAGCTDVELKFAERSACARVVPDDSYSTTCYMPAKIGFFSVTYVEYYSYSVVFSRWD